MRTFSHLVNESNKIEVTRTVVLTLSSGVKIQGSITVQDISTEFATQTILDELLNQTIVDVEIEDEDNFPMIQEEEEELVDNCVLYCIDQSCLDELITCDKYAIVNFLKDEDCVDNAFTNAHGEICIETSDRYVDYLEKELSKFCDNEVQFKLNCK